MKVLRVVCMLGSLASALGCSDTHRLVAQDDGCSDGAACTCSDGRQGQKVCDLDTRETVMCQCPGKSRGPNANSEEDAGSTLAPEDAGPRPMAGRAAEGGRGGSAAGAGGQPASDPATPHRGKGQDKKAHKDAGGEDDQP